VSTLCPLGLCKHKGLDFSACSKELGAGCVLGASMVTHTELDERLHAAYVDSIKLSRHICCQQLAEFRC
jgi:hypothetical protein